MGVVTGNEPDKVEKDGGGWVVVETQRKTREVLTRQEESRTGRVKRLYPALARNCERNLDWLVRQEEMLGRKELKRLEEEEAECWRETDARLARG